jgi:hypothetical protein
MFRSVSALACTMAFVVSAHAQSAPRTLTVLLTGQPTRHGLAGLGDNEKLGATYWQLATARVSDRKERRFIRLTTQLQRRGREFRVYRA